MNFQDITGKVIDSIDLDSAADRITFRFQDGFTRSYGVEGDCCSRSWIEHLETPPDIRGATITSVEDSSGVEPYDDHACVSYDYDKSDTENKAAGYCGHDSLAVYNTRFRTDRGDIVLEYRNDSNGYYGGYLTD
jgi:hypothetical protein